MPVVGDQQQAQTTKPPCSCPLCDGTVRVLVAFGHAAMAKLTGELLSREFGSAAAVEVMGGGFLSEAIVRYRPDLVVVDSGAFPGWRRAAQPSFPRNRVVVVGPEPDSGYRSAALIAGAGSWICRDCIGDDLVGEMRRVIGCVRDPGTGAGMTATANAAGGNRS